MEATGAQGAQWRTQCPRTDKTKSPYLDQRLPQHESLKPIGQKSQRIEIPHIGFHYIQFKNLIFTNTEYIHTHFSIMILLSKKVPNV